MGRKKKVAVIKTLGDADRALGELLVCTHRLESLSQERESQIAKARKRFEKQVRDAEQEKAALEAALREALVQNWDAWRPAKRRSIKLRHGSLGFRKQVTIQIRPNTLELLERLGLTQPITVTKNVSKAVLAQWSDEKLAQVGANRHREDEPYYRLHREVLSGGER